MPHKLQTDWKKEFLNQPLNNLLKQCNVHHFVTNNEAKSSVRECLYGMLKSKMWSYFTAHDTFCYIDVLSEFMKSCNQSFPRAVRARPVDVNTPDSARVWKTGGGGVFETKNLHLFSKRETMSGRLEKTRDFRKVMSRNSQVQFS